MKLKYYPYSVKMYRGVTKITVTVWSAGNVEASRDAQKKYPGFEVYFIQAQWHYQNKLVAI